MNEKLIANEPAKNFFANLLYIKQFSIFSSLYSLMLLIPQRCGWIQACGSNSREPGGQEGDYQE